MKKKSLKRVKLITGNTIRQVLISVFSVAIPFFVIHFSTKEIWGAFVSVFLFCLFASQVINWGNKEYLLRKFSETPSKITDAFSENLATRLPILLLFSIAAFFLFPVSFGFWIMIWLFGRYLIHSVEPLILYQKRFDKSIMIEVLSFIIFGLSLYFLKSEIKVYSLLMVFSFYQFLRGCLYILHFRKFFLFEKASIQIDYFKQSFSFFLLSIFGFFISKVDVYIINYFSSKTIVAEYQIINSLLVFAISISAFVYAPFTKNIYRSTENVIKKTKQTLMRMGLVITLMAITTIYIAIRFYLKTSFSYVFYIIAFFYIYPSYVYGLDIVNLFKKHKEKIVIKNLLIGACLNAILSSSFLFLGLGLNGALLGSTLSQLIIMIQFLKIKKND